MVVVHKAVLQFFCLFCIDFDEFLLVLDGLWFEYLFEHLLDRLKSGVVFHSEAIENGVKINIRFEDVIVHVGDATHSLLELRVLAFFEEIERVLLLGGRGLLHLWLTNLIIMKLQ